MKIPQKLKSFFDSKTSTRVLELIGVAIVVLLVFSAGIAIGFHRASFGRDWMEHYDENFGAGMISARRSVGGNYFPNAHGATGKILKIELPNIIVEGRDELEKTILTTDDTQVQNLSGKITAADLRIDDFIVVIGVPDAQGQIDAKLIRVIPMPNYLNRINTTEKHV